MRSWRYAGRIHGKIGAAAAAHTRHQARSMAKKFPLHPKHPERICWGCDRYCPTDSMACGNGSGRTMHPAETLGDDWYTVGDWGFDEGDDKAGVKAGVTVEDPPARH